jgi:predicted amidohydrolase YtcJ
MQGRAIWHRPLTVLLYFVAVLTSVASLAKDADLIIHNADIYTVDADRSRANALAVADGRIVAVGTSSDVNVYRGDNTRMLDAGGRLLLPGFIDCHNHIRYGGDPTRISLDGIKNLEELSDRIDAFVAERPDTEWIRGSGWVYSIFPDGRLPTAADLDELTVGYPALLTAYDGHTMWLNSEAMRRIGIDSTTTAVGFGVLDKDERGHPTGIIFGAAGSGDDEDWEQLTNAMPQQSEEEAYQQLAANLDRAAQFGITTIVEPQEELAGLVDFERAFRDGDLKSRLRIALFHPVGTEDGTIEEFAETIRTFGNDRMRVSAIKLYVDDVIESQKAALLEPYTTDPESRGETFYSSGDFDAVVGKLDSLGLQLFIHAIGDRAIRVALDALERARKMNGARDARHQLVHVELLNEADIARFNELDVVACMQPRHLSQDLTLQWARAVGEERAKLAWAMRSLLDQEATLALSSDWPVAEMDPLVGIYTAVSRRTADGAPSDGWQPHQRITVAEAIAGYTEGSAYANHLENEVGSIEVGKAADLIILSDDIFNIGYNSIKDAQVVLTLLEGKPVFDPGGLLQ